MLPLTWLKSIGFKQERHLLKIFSSKEKWGSKFQFGMPKRESDNKKILKSKILGSS